MLRYYIDQIEKASMNTESSVAARSPGLLPEKSPKIDKEKSPKEAPTVNLPVLPSPAKRGPGRPPKKQKLDDESSPVKKENPRAVKIESVLAVTSQEDSSDDERAKRLKARKLLAMQLEDEDVSISLGMKQKAVKERREEKVSEKIRKVEGKKVKRSYIRRNLPVKRDLPPPPVKRGPGRPPRVITPDNTPVKVCRKIKQSERQKEPAPPRRMALRQIEPVVTQGTALPDFRFLDHTGDKPWWKERISLSRVVEADNLSVETFIQLPPLCAALPVDPSSLSDDFSSFAKSVYSKFAFLNR